MTPSVGSARVPVHFPHGGQHGLDVGVPDTRWLERPRGLAYEFAQRLNLEVAWGMEEGVGLFAHGDGNNYAWFDRKAVRRLLREFAKERRLTAPQRAEINAWVSSLPWQGDVIELHFNW